MNTRARSKPRPLLSILVPHNFVNAREATTVEQK